MIIKLSQEKRNKRRMELIKILLKDVIIKERETEKFINNMEKNDCLFNIYITEKIENIFFEILELLGITDEDEQDKICEYIANSEDDIDRLVEKFCKKYQI